MAGRYNKVQILDVQSHFQQLGLVVCATIVRTARRRTFSNVEISADAVLASACLPDLFPAVSVDGVRLT